MIPFARSPYALGLAVMGAVLASVAAPARGQDDVAIETRLVAGSVHMLTGQGGNLGFSVGTDGVFLIDDQFAPLTERILAAIGKVSDRPVRFVLNTHWHGDHTGGNENIGRTGAIIVAHENVRRRMSEEQFIEAFGRTVPPSPREALPVVTFADTVTFHWNDDTIEVVHVAPAHTDGDAVVFFRRANVVHMGDVYFSGMYPFIDASSGGRIAGVIAAVDRVLARTNDRTRFIPGHGRLTGVKELRAYRAMLETVRTRLRALIDEGRSREEIVAAKPTADLDAQWATGFLGPDQFVGIVYDGMTRE